jgi:predicted nucleic acid-binding protein
VDVTAIPNGTRVYLDANVWIYTLEGYAEFVASVTASFARIDVGELVAVTSELTLAEVLVKPFADDNTELQQQYTELLQSSESLLVIPVSKTLWIDAAELRAKHTSLKLPDAVHAVTAIANAANDFISNDSRFVSVSGLRVYALTPT